MKIKRTDLLQDLENVLPGVANKEIIEQTDCFIFRNKSIMAYNDIMAISHPTDLSITAAVKAKELHALLSKLSQEEIDFDLDENKILIKEKSEKSENESWIAIEQEITLPTDEITIPDKWIKLPLDFITAIENCLFSVAKDMSLELLTNLHCANNYMESCEINRISRYFFEGGYRFKKEILLPYKQAVELKKYKPTKYNTKLGWVYFKTDDGTVLSIRTMEGEFKNFDFVFQLEGELFKFPQNIQDSIDRSEIFSKNQMDENDSIVQIELKKNLFQIKGESVNGGITERIKVNYVGEPISFSIHPKYLREIVGKIRKTKIVKRENQAKMLIFEAENFTHAVDLEVE